MCYTPCMEGSTMSLTTVEISASAKAFAEAKAREAGLDSAGAFLERLIDRARRREETRARVERLCLEGLDSGPLVPLTREDLNEIRREGQRLIAERRAATPR